MTRSGTGPAEGGGGLTGFLDETRAWVEAGLERRLPPEGAPPRRLHGAMRYAVFGGGKRLRPALVRMVARELGGSDRGAILPAVAIELIHTYSLVHDDLPCMDDDDLRRGRPTCHVAFDEATAVLVGDALQTLAFEVLSGADGDRAGALVAVLAQDSGAAGIVGGQVLDLHPADGQAGLEGVRDVHARKTAALFAAAAEMGAIAAGADGGKRALTRGFGLSLGLCFQAVDDLLDVTADAATLGKTPGKDAALGRSTLVAVLGPEEARGEAIRLAREARGAAEGLGFGGGSLPVELVELVLARGA